MDQIKPPAGRSYGQFCALARALDVVGDRWNLLIVRELLAGPLRYGELKDSLDGIATNLLAARLRSMEDDGVIERRLEPKTPGVLYALTTWGAQLQEPLESLGCWGVPLLATGQGDDSFQPRWLTLALPALLRGRTSSSLVEVGFEVDGLLMVLRIDRKGASAKVATDKRPATVLTASPETVVGLVTGALSVKQAVAAGELVGDVGVLKRAFPPPDAVPGSR